MSEVICCSDLGGSKVPRDRCCCLWSPGGSIYRNNSFSGNDDVPFFLRIEGDDGELSLQVYR